VDRVLSAVNRANQRGGRMLSLVDLLEAGTVVSYELSSGTYEAYIWGPEVRRLARLAREAGRHFLTRSDGCPTLTGGGPR
jgi:hypothetical protein